MSKPDIDFRIALTAEIDEALTAYARGFNLDRQTVARMILQEWTVKFDHANTVYRALKKANGRLTDASRQVPDSAQLKLGDT